METTWIATTRLEENATVGWEYGTCIWAPTTDKRGGRGRYEIIRELKLNDVVIHVRNSVFTGESIVAEEAYETVPPPNPGPWLYAKRFYRVNLKEYKAFPITPTVQDLFAMYGEKIMGDIGLNKPHRYPFAIYHYYQKPPILNTVQGRFLTIATPLLKELLSVATALEKTKGTHPAPRSLGKGERM